MSHTTRPLTTSKNHNLWSSNWCRWNSSFLTCFLIFNSKIICLNIPYLHQFFFENFAPEPETGAEPGGRGRSRHNKKSYFSLENRCIIELSTDFWSKKILKFFLLISRNKITSYGARNVTLKISFATNSYTKLWNYHWNWKTNVFYK